MDRISLYRQRAAECRELAQGALTTEMRDHYKELARLWDKMADDLIGGGNSLSGNGYRPCFGHGNLSS